MRNALFAMTGTGGLLRVRAILVMALTGVGGAYILLNQSMPPGEYNVLWSMGITHYFATRGSNGGM